MRTKLWYSTIGHLATRWLSPFSSVARARAHVHIIFTAVCIEKRSGKKGHDVSFNESHVLYYKQSTFGLILLYNSYVEDATR